MGGGRAPSPASSAEEEDFPPDFSLNSDENKSPIAEEVDFPPVVLLNSDENKPVFGEFGDVSNRTSLDDLVKEAIKRRKQNVYAEVLKSYDDLQARIESLEEAKSKILSYSPGAWTEKAGMSLSDYDIPKTTTLLLIGPKGSGKSSLVNRISRVLEDNEFPSERAQVFCSSSLGDGTYFLQGYMIPRGSTSICVYDTRGLSTDPLENQKTLEFWMANGVRHGEPITRGSDSLKLKTTLKWKAGRTCFSFERRMVNSVILVVNGLSVLKSIDSRDEAAAKYIQLVANTFNMPCLSFKDDKPIVIVTHGDLLSLADRARIRVCLGEMLGIPPKGQVFDIPESSEQVTDLAIVDMLRCSLEHADRNLPGKSWIVPQVFTVLRGIDTRMMVMFLVIIAAVATAMFRNGHSSGANDPQATSPSSGVHTIEPGGRIDWGKIRHLWLGSDYD